MLFYANIRVYVKTGLTLLWMLITLAVLNCKAQSIIIPPAPGAANFAQSVNMPMGLYTGTPQINIPIYTIEVGEFKLPITINYNPGGVKVTDIASWCGLNWNLNAGGIIARSIVGIADEMPAKGYLALSIPDSLDPCESGVYDPSSPCAMSACELHCRIALGELDGQPDLYSFSLPGAAGRLVWDRNKRPKPLPMQNLFFNNWSAAPQYFPNFPSIVPGYDGCPKYDTVYGTYGWGVEDGMGNKYAFEDVEKSFTRIRRITPSPFPGFSHDFDTCYKGVSAWYLSSIYTRGGHEIEFQYDTVVLAYDLPVSFEYIGKVGNASQWQSSGTYPRQFMITQRLSAINFPDGKIKFIASTKGRADLIGDKALEKIVIENAKGEIVKQFRFEYDYLLGYALNYGDSCRLVPFDSVTLASGESNLFPYSPPTYPSNSPALNRRLLLRRIVEQDKVGMPLNQGTRFEYIHDIGLPPRNESRQADYWGFANGKHSGDEVEVLPDGTLDFKPEWKNPNTAYALQGSLNKIIHPTGSYVQFNYEGNVAIDLLTPPPGGIYYTSSVGGIRLNNQISVDPLTPDSGMIKKYYYEDGVSTSEPSYKYTFNNGEYIKLSSSSVYPLTATQGAYVGYRKVTESSSSIYNGANKGKTEYYFTTPQTNPDIVYLTKPNLSTPAQLMPNPPVDNRDWQRGLLVKKEVFETRLDTFLLKQSTDYSYNVILDSLGKALKSDFFNSTHILTSYQLYGGRMEQNMKVASATCTMPPA